MSNSPLLLIASKQGQLGNRLALFARFIALSVETNIPIVNLGFGDYAKYFTSTAPHAFCRYYSGDNFYSHPTVQNLFNLYRIYLKALKARASFDTSFAEIDSLPAQVLDAPVDDLSRDTLLEFAYLMIAQTYSKRLPPDITEAISIEEQIFSLEVPATIAKFYSSSKIWLMDGWGFQAPTWVIKHAEIIRRYFTPLPQHCEKISSIVGQARAKGSFLVGVHIRRKDYAEFCNGRYFFEIHHYAAAMKELSRRVEADAVFLLCSDETLSYADFPDLNCHISDGNLVEDMYALSRCDLILGPPSTFSGWSSYYGGVRKIELDREMSFIAEFTSGGF